MEVINHLENLNLEYELDSAYGEFPEEQAELDSLVGKEKVVLCGEPSGVLEDCHYLYIDPDYSGALSPGQRQLYELLLSWQESAVYTLTTLEKLAKAMGLKWSLAAGKRLENLQSLGAISGLKN